jgi:translation initiation factor 5B
VRDSLDSQDASA